VKLSKSIYDTIPNDEFLPLYKSSSNILSENLTHLSVCEISQKENLLKNEFDLKLPFNQNKDFKTNNRILTIMEENTNKIEEIKELQIKILDNIKNNDDRIEKFEKAIIGISQANLIKNNKEEILFISDKKDVNLKNYCRNKTQTFQDPKPTSKKILYFQNYLIK